MRPISGDLDLARAAYDCFYHLHRVEEITIENGWLLAGKHFTLEDDPADIESVAQKVGERAPRVNGTPPTVRPVLSDRTLVTMPRWRRSEFRHVLGSTPNVK